MSGCLLAQQSRQADALVGARGGHPDVRHHHVRMRALDRIHERGQVLAGGHHLYVRVAGEDPRYALAGDHAVVGQRDRN
jgi:hypothetical protein